MKYILYNTVLGVYVGSFMGLGFWSKLDEGGQETAVCFDSEQQGKEYVASWENPVEEGESSFIPVETQDRYIHKDLIDKYW